jgi:hypothetical protein
MIGDSCLLENDFMVYLFCCFIGIFITSITHVPSVADSGIKNDSLQSKMRTRKLSVSVCLSLYI